LIVITVFTSEATYHSKCLETSTLGLGIKAITHVSGL
jgi:hypothetical protein